MLAVVFGIRLDDTRLDACVFVKLFEMENEVGSMGERAEQADVEVVTVLFGFEGPIWCDLAVKRIVWSRVPRRWESIGGHGTVLDGSRKLS